MAGAAIKAGAKAVGDVAQTLLNKESKATRKAKKHQVVADAAKNMKHLNSSKNMGGNFKGAYGGK